MKTPAQKARDAGFARVLGNAPLLWRESYYRLLRAQPPEIPEPFLGEDLKAYAIARIGHPHHHNAWGATWNAAKRWGLFLPTGAQAQMRAQASHARKSDLYVWNRVKRGEDALGSPK